MTNTNLPRIFGRVQAILLDFDGPVCAVFSGHPADGIATQLRMELARLGQAAFNTHEQDPLLILRSLTDLPNDVYQTMESIIQTGEDYAVESASPTPGTDGFLSACKEYRLPVVIVTNNSRSAVERYFNRLNLQENIAGIFARNPNDPSLMKPNPYLVNQAIRHIGIPSKDCVLVGDSPTDIAAAHGAGTLSIGYANKPGKLERLQAVKADAVILSMNELTCAVAKTLWV